MTGIEIFRLLCVTQQNAALVEQTAAASKSLQEQARKLVGVFNLDQNQVTDNSSDKKVSAKPLALTSSGNQSNIVIAQKSERQTLAHSSTLDNNRDEF